MNIARTMIGKFKLGALQVCFLVLLLDNLLWSASVLVAHFILDDVTYSVHEFVHRTLTHAAAEGDRGTANSTTMAHPH